MRRKSALLLLLLVLVAGCTNNPALPFYDGTHRESPAVKRFEISLRFESEAEIDKHCRADQNPAGFILDACVDVLKYADYHSAVIHMPWPRNPTDVWFWETLIHEVAHPLFQWRHSRKGASG